jgi:ABC-2 type transport system permease protein
MLNLTRLLAISRKELIQLRRDSRSMILAFLLPVVLVILFGYAITWDVSAIPRRWWTRTTRSRSRELMDAFRSSGYFEIGGPPRPDRGPGRPDRPGRRWLGLVIPPGFAADLEAGRRATVQAHHRRQRREHGHHRERVRQRRGALVLGPDPPGRADLPAAGAPGEPGLVQRGADQPEHDRAGVGGGDHDDHRGHAHVPHHRPGVGAGDHGAAGVDAGPAGGGGAGQAAAVRGHRAHGRGPGERHRRVPVRRAVPRQRALLMALSLAFIIGSLGFGIFISAVARSQLLATQMAMITTFLPAFLLSGFMYSISVMPRCSRGSRTWCPPATSWWSRGGSSSRAWAWKCWPCRGCS